jgi:hypothetical protein
MAVRSTPTLTSQTVALAYTIALRPPMLTPPAQVYLWLQGKLQHDLCNHSVIGNLVSLILLVRV